jgi:hypothetical protein
MKKSLLLFFILVVGLQKSFAQTTPFIYTDTVAPVILNLTPEEENNMTGSTVILTPPSRRIKVPIRTNGTFLPGNKFKVILSDTLGFFSNDTLVLGTFEQSGNVGNIVLNVDIPYTDFINLNFETPIRIMGSDRYRIRVESTNPVVIGSPNAYSYNNQSSGVFIGFVEDVLEELDNNDITKVIDWIQKTMASKLDDFCWRQGVSVRLPVEGLDRTPNTCPPGQVMFGALCYAPCGENYSNVGGVCWESCPSGWFDGGVFCYPSVTTKAAPSLLGDCPTDYDNTGIECYRWFRSDYHPSRMASCPSGYTNMGLTCTNWNTWHTVNLHGNASCPTNYFLGVLDRCYYSCPTGWNNDGEFCSRPDASITYANGMFCPAGYEPLSNYTFGRCYQRCEEGWTNTLETCLNNVLSITKYSYVIPAYPLVCKSGLDMQIIPAVPIPSPPFLIPIPFCYQPCPTGSTSVLAACMSSCQSDWTFCGLGCAKDVTTCATTIAGQVWSVISTVQAISSFMAPGAGAGTAATGVIVKEALKMGPKVVEGAGKALKFTARLMRSIRQMAPVIQRAPAEASKVSRFWNGCKNFGRVVKSTGAIFWSFSGGTYVDLDGRVQNKLVSSVTNGITQMNAMAAANSMTADFIIATDEDVNAQIDLHFKPALATQIKKKWCQVRIQQMAQAELLANVRTGLGIASTILAIEPTGIVSGIVGIVEAFTHPICNFPYEFPTLSKNYQ